MHNDPSTFSASSGKSIRPTDHGGRSARVGQGHLLPSRQEAALLAITVVWGATFLTVQQGLALAGPLSFVTLRFGTAAVLTAALCLPSLKGLTWRELGAGSLIGASLFVGYGLQTIGLQTISSSTSAFLTALYVPLVPLLQWACMRQRPNAANWTGIAVAFAGLLLLTGATTSGLRFGSGELITLASTIGIAIEILLISRFAGTVGLRRVTVVQLAVCALLAAAARPLTGEPLPPPSWLLLAFAGGLGVASALIQMTMNWAQRRVSPARATVIYAGEPVWAGVVGRIAGERLGAAALVGCALIVTAVLISELKPRRRTDPHPQSR